MPLRFSPQSHEDTKYSCRTFLGVLVAWWLILFGPSYGAAVPAAKLIQELACFSCHSGPAPDSDISSVTPDLGHAGLRYDPAYLFDYLQHPTKVRLHLGFSRMPDFHFSAKESLALTLFLKEQKRVEGNWPEYPQNLREAAPSRDSDLREARSLIVDYFSCTKCHALGAEKSRAAVDGIQAVDLATVGFRLNQTWVAQYLVEPNRFHPSSDMPNVFYDLDVERRSFKELVPDAARQIHRITGYLSLLGKERHDQLQRSYDQARRSYPEIDAAMGKSIFISQNCLACHRHAAGGPRQKKNAPDLNLTSVRVLRDWLTAYLGKPTAVRPFGYYPGSGSRMPDFRLTTEEVQVITDSLLKQPLSETPRLIPFTPSPLSAFAMNKASRLLREKLPCLGCHQLGNEGGRVGPNLSHASSRLQGSFLYSLISNPQGVMPGIIMPKVLMSERDLDLVANFLLQQDTRKPESAYLSLVDSPPYVLDGTESGRDPYLNYCAPCHGVRGDGSGFNAKYLPQLRVDHSDAVQMSKRADDTLFDLVYAGGYVFNKSHRMPSWGQTLTPKGIRQLVTYMRQLCRCEGPAWSRDKR